jgi:hypothetical protein
MKITTVFWIQNCSMPSCKTIRERITQLRLWVLEDCLFLRNVEFGDPATQNKTGQLYNEIISDHRTGHCELMDIGIEV